jgi:hypothetical protein
MCRDHENGQGPVIQKTENLNTSHTEFAVTAIAGKCITSLRDSLFAYSNTLYLIDNRIEWPHYNKITRIPLAFGEARRTIPANENLSGTGPRQ